MTTRCLMGVVVERAELGLEGEFGLAGELELEGDEVLGGEPVAADTPWLSATVARADPMLSNAVR
jgi:hypothetical protein